MTAPTGASSPLLLTTLARLDARGSESQGWPRLSAVRQRAAHWVRAHGLPHPKQEGWRFTPLGAIVNLAPSEPRAAQAVTELAALNLSDFGIDEARAVRISRAGIRWRGGALPPGVEAWTLAEWTQRDPDAVAATLDFGSEPATAFAAVNTALFEDLLVLRVAEGAQPEWPVQLLVTSSASDRPTVNYPRLVVLAGRHSELELVEVHVGSGSEAFLSNSVVQVRLQEGARLGHTRVEYGTPQSRRIGLLDVQQERDSTYASRVVTLGGAFSRVDLRLHLAGKGAQADLSGLYHADSDEQVGLHTVVWHEQPHCASRQLYRGVLGGRGRAVFDGIVHVLRGAQGTDAHQDNRNLILSDEAVVNTKPHLEIDADDVKCSHGASIGRIDDEQLFYLRSRGLAEPDARAMLADGFAREVIESIHAGSVREAVGAEIGRRLRNCQGG